MTTTQASIHVKVDPEIKTKSETILNKIGISMSDLINMTLRRVIHERRIPFDTTVDADAIPECLNIQTEAEFYALIDKRITENESNFLTLDEVRKNLNLS